jgi:ATP-dependent protease ClpP protease subunit
MLKELLLTALTGCTLANAATVKGTAEHPVYVLDKNTLVLNTEIDDNTVAPIISKIYSSNKKELVLYINSPGGSIESGNSLINAMKSSGKHITCISEFSASMAAAILEVGCDTRIAMSNSVLMFHEASYSLPRQESANKQHQFIAFLERMISTLEHQQAKRMKLTYDV